MNQEHNIDRKTEDEKEKFLEMKKKLKYFGIRSGLLIMDGDALYKSKKGDKEWLNWCEVGIKGVLNGKGFSLFKLDYKGRIEFTLKLWELEDDGITIDPTGEFRTIKANNDGCYNDLFERYGHLECGEYNFRKKHEDEKYSKLLDLFEELELVAIPKLTEEDVEKE
jgi:hypothetical protein